MISGTTGIVHDTCRNGYRDVSYTESGVNCSAPDTNCASYTGDFIDPLGKEWLVALGGITMALMAFGIGGNDVANSWATSVGSGAIDLKWACLTAGVMNWLGAVALGYGVSSKITKGVASTTTPDCWACGYCDSLMSVYAVGMFGSLVGGAVFLLLAIKLKLPVSTTHAIVGGVVGVTTLGLGTQCLNTEFPRGLAGIGASWVISPLLSGLIGCMMYGITKFAVFKRTSPREAALLALPILFSLTTFVMILLILLKAGPTKKLDKRMMTLYAFGVTCGVFIAVWVFLRPYIVKRMPSNNLPQTVDGAHKQIDSKSEEAKHLSEGMEMQGFFVAISNNVGAVSDGDTSENTGSDTKNETASHEKEKEETLMEALIPTKSSMMAKWSAKFSSRFGEEADKKTREHLKELRETEQNAMTVEEKDAMFVFRYLLVFIAACESFAHGANDTANSTAAFSQILNVYNHGLYACDKQYTPVWIMAIAGAFVMLGICTVGHRVIERIGKELTAINFQRGFCIEFGSTMSIIIATVLEMPVSTTHCQIGAVFFVGLASFGCKEVQWTLMGQIVLSWLFTIPAAGIISGMLTAAGGYWMMDYRNNPAFEVITNIYTNASSGL